MGLQEIIGETSGEHIKDSGMDEFGNEICLALFCLMSILQAIEDIHLDVRQFGAIDVYHYREEHCFVPQLNVSGLSKRKSVGPVIAQEIPDGNAS